MMMVMMMMTMLAALQIGVGQDPRNLHRKAM
jgi:hypothetical protein